MRPISFGKPFVSLFHVRPPSIDLYTPPFSLPLRCVHGLRSKLHIPAYRMLGFVGSISRSATLCWLSMYRVLVHDLPPSVVINTPRSSLVPNAWPSAPT